MTDEEQATVRFFTQAFPKPTEQTQAPSPELAELLREIAGGKLHSDMVQTARAILAELEPKVDPLNIHKLAYDFAEATEAVFGWPKEKNIPAFHAAIIELAKEQK